jgi:subfamily B ATP-binding cassette protein MsbA
MEFLTGIMIAFLIFYSAKLISKNELEVSNFFSFLSCNDACLSTCKISCYFKYCDTTRLSGARRVLPIIDDIQKLKIKNNAKELILKMEK